MDHDQIEKAITNLKIGSTGTRLYDALSDGGHVCCEIAQESRLPARDYHCGRSAGQWQRSKTWRRSFAKRSFPNVVIYTVGLSIDVRSDFALTAAAIRPEPGYASGHIRGAVRFPATAQTPIDRSGTGRATAVISNLLALAGMGGAACQQPS